MSKKMEYLYTLRERVHAMDMNISSFWFAQVGQKLEFGYGS